ncbi:hypothetical protein ACMFMG_001972 [Clarireedia jacksonii]
MQQFNTMEPAIEKYQLEYFAFESNNPLTAPITAETLKIHRRIAFFVRTLQQISFLLCIILRISMQVGPKTWWCRHPIAAELCFRWTILQLRTCSSVGPLTKMLRR